MIKGAKVSATMDEPGTRFEFCVERKDKSKMRINKLVRSILKTAVYVLDQTSDQVDRATSRATDFADDAREMISPSDHTLRNVLGFAAGIGVGVGLGVLLAPTSGAELRDSITDKVQDIGNRVRGRAPAYMAGSEAQ